MNELQARAPVDLIEPVLKFAPHQRRLRHNDLRPGIHLQALRKSASVKNVCVKKRQFLLTGTKFKGKVSEAVASPMRCTIVAWQQHLLRQA